MLWLAAEICAAEKCYFSLDFASLCDLASLREAKLPGGYLTQRREARKEKPQSQTPPAEQNVWRAFLQFAKMPTLPFLLALPR